MRRLMRGVALVLAALAVWGCAAGEGLTLPDGTRTVEAEAFAGDTALEEIRLPEGVAAVGAGAFAGCEGLDIAVFDGQETDIAEDAFDGCGPALLIRAPQGSSAHRFAAAHSLDYQAGTRYRALIIAQDYQGVEGVNPLLGPPADAVRIRTCLQGLPGTPWEVTTAANLTADQLCAVMAGVFAEAGEADVSLVWYSGHGGYQAGYGSFLLGTDREWVSAARLRTVLDRVPGRKILVIDACNSGGLLTDTALQSRGSAAGDDGGDVDAFVSGMLAPFATRSRASLAGSGYFVMAACARDELSYELTGDGLRYGVFTGSLLTGIGYRVPQGSWAASPAADENRDLALSFREAFAYAQRETRTVMQQYGISQNAACYPENCGWFAPFRYR